jgi:hypothetical protein
VPQAERTPHEIIAEKVAALEKLADTHERRVEALERQKDGQRGNAVRCQKAGNRDGAWQRQSLRGGVGKRRGNVPRPQRLCCGCAA